MKLDIKINIKVLFWGITLFFLYRFWSPVFINGTQFAPFYTLVSKLIAASILGYYLFVYRKITIPFILIAFYFIIRFGITVCYKPENVTRVFMEAYPVLALVSISEILLNSQKDIYIESVSLILRWMCILNAIQSLFFPNLFYGKYLIGGENQIVFSYILSAVLEKYRCGEKKYILYLIFLTLSVLKIFSAGNLLGWFIFLLIYFFYNKPRTIKAISIFRGYCIGWILIVVVRIQNVFSWLIEDVLHKNLTFTNRTIIWDQALQWIRKKPLFGYGVQDRGDIFYIYIYRTGRPTVNAWLSAHNQIIQTLYESGIISMIPIILLCILGVKIMDLNRKNKMYPIMIAGIIGISVSMIAEAPGWYSLLILLIWAINIKKFENERQTYL